MHASMLAAKVWIGTLLDFHRTKGSTLSGLSLSLRFGVSTSSDSMQGDSVLCGEAAGGTSTRDRIPVATKLKAHLTIVPAGQIARANQYLLVKWSKYHANKPHGCVVSFFFEINPTEEHHPNIAHITAVAYLVMHPHIPVVIPTNSGVPATIEPCVTMNPFVREESGGRSKAGHISEDEGMDSLTIMAHPTMFAMESL
ncbi:hypothetical protein Pelo_18456 [Pelomyxa schiedti]|nr:hypothetical protein Pelo_18456 [Pelomyxa schiedti]